MDLLDFLAKNHQPLLCQQGFNQTAPRLQKPIPSPKPQKLPSKPIGSLNGTKPNAGKNQIKVIKLLIEKLKTN